MTRATIAPIIFILAILSGCGGYARTRIDAPIAGDRLFSSAIVTHEVSKDGYQPSADLVDTFNDRLKNELRLSGFSSSADDLVIKYHIVSGYPGSQSARYWQGNGAGAGEVVFDVSYEDVKGTSIAKTTVTGTVSQGWFGGAYSRAFNTAAVEVDEFAQGHLRSATAAARANRSKPSDRE